MILHSEDRLTFLVEVHVTPPLDLSKGKESWRGGDLVMHKLAYKLAERGQRVVIFSEPTFLHENIFFIPSINYDSGVWVLNESIQFPLNETISIYPQIQPGQPFKTKFNARWFLSDDLNHSWIESENDAYFNFSTWKTDRSTQHLKAVHYNFENLYKTNNGRRKGFCHILHKNTPEDYESILKPFNSEDISDWIERGGISYLREKLNEYEYLITFDKHTAMTYLPGLCGCKTILYNAVEHTEWKNMTPEEYRLKHPHRKYGCAFGIEDIEWANKTIDLVPDHLREMEKLDDKTVDNFIEFWEKKVELKI
ncbi:hypothetical protein CMI38_06330 [Candidatus Pacearchaeota archaeon]|nr:hypothetical protein [Candidatus Pacearchaeota archaeon]|tara:strand:+ start:133 stop:1059 length:927 start_codon:yes stop_codon:yes gene_type:complete